VLTQFHEDKSLDDSLKSQPFYSPIYINNQSIFQQSSPANYKNSSQSPNYSTEQIPSQGIINTYNLKTKVNALKPSSLESNLINKPNSPVSISMKPITQNKFDSRSGQFYPSKPIGSFGNSAQDDFGTKLGGKSELETAPVYVVNQNLTLSPYHKPQISAVQSGSPGSTRKDFLQISPQSGSPGTTRKEISPTSSKISSPVLTKRDLPPPSPKSISSRLIRRDVLTTSPGSFRRDTKNQFLLNQDSFANKNGAAQFLHIQTDYVSKVEPKSEPRIAPVYDLSQNLTRREILSANPQPDTLLASSVNTISKLEDKSDIETAPVYVVNQNLTLSAYSKPQTSAIQPDSPGSTRKEILSPNLKTISPILTKKDFPPPSPQPGSPGSTRRDILSTSSQPGSPVLTRKDLPPLSPQSGSPSMIKRDILSLTEQQSSPGSIRRDLPAMTAQSTSPNRISPDCSLDSSEPDTLKESSINQSNYSVNILETQKSLANFETENQVQIPNEIKRNNSEILNLKSNPNLNLQVSELANLNGNRNFNSQMSLVKSEGTIKTNLETNKIESMNQISEVINDISYEKEESFVTQDIEHEEKVSLMLNENYYEKIDDHIQTKDEKIESVIQKETEKIVAPIRAAIIEEPDASEVTPTESTTKKESTKQDVSPVVDENSNVSPVVDENSNVSPVVDENSNVSPVVDESESVEQDSKILSVVEDLTPPFVRPSTPSTTKKESTKQEPITFKVKLAFKVVNKTNSFAENVTPAIVVSESVKPDSTVSFIVENITQPETLFSPLSLKSPMTQQSGNQIMDPTISLKPNSPNSIKKDISITPASNCSNKTLKNSQSTPQSVISKESFFKKFKGRCTVL